MSKTKRDFRELKIDFFTSDEKELKGFIEKKLGKGKRNGNIQKKTAGRVKEREDYLNNILNKALENSEKDIEERIKAKIIKVENLYFQLTLTLEERLKHPENLNISDLYTIRKIIRTEKNLPINITKAEVKEDKKENELSEEEKERIDKRAEQMKENELKASKFDKLGLKLEDE